MVLAVSVYNHYKRILSKDYDNSVELRRAMSCWSVPLVSARLPAQNLARMLKVPFAIADATTLTEAAMSVKTSKIFCSS